MANHLEIKKFPTHSVYQTGIIIGQGSYAVIDKRILGGNYVAVKTAKKPNERSCQFNEINILSGLCHDNVVKMVGILDDPEPKLVLEFVEYGCLFEYISLHKEITETEQLNILKGISEGMQYLHDINIVHRDIASRNILIGSQLQAKVSDFGFSMQTNDANFYACFEYSEREFTRIPYRYLPPESVAGLPGGTPGSKCFYSKSADMWSYAVIIWEMMEPGQIPFKQFGQKNSVEIVKQICSGAYPICYSKLDTFMSNLSQAIFKCPHDARPMFKEIAETLKKRQDDMITNELTHQIQQAPSSTTVDELTMDRYFPPSYSQESGYGSSSFVATYDEEMKQLTDNPEIDTAVVFQNVTTVLPDMDFATGIFKKFGRPDLKINMIKRLSSKSLAIGIRAKSGKKQMSSGVVQSLVSMVEEIKACSSVYSTPLRVNLYNRMEINKGET